MRVNELLPRLKGVSTDSNGWSAHCPAHPDSKPSLSIAEGDDGKILIKCHRGCPTKEVVHALGLTMADLAPEAFLAQQRRKEIIETYPYRDADGVLLFEVVRFRPKTFCQRRPDPNKPGEWIWSMRGVKRVLFRLPELLAGIKAGSPVYICEGEKDCLAIVRAGGVATCNPMGAGKWLPAFNTSFAGANVIIIADRDDPGRSHAETVASQLLGSAASVRVIELPDVGNRPVKDAADYLAAGGCIEGITEIAEGAPHWTESRKTPDLADRPWVELPGDNRLVSSFAKDLAVGLRKAQLFNHGGIVMEPNWQGDSLEAIAPERFRTWCEKYVSCVRTKKDDEVERTMSREDAGAVLVSSQFLDSLPRVERVNSIRLPVIRANGDITLLPSGYDEQSLTFTTDSCPYRSDMAVEDALAVIGDLFSEFPFQADEGRSRAVAIAALVGLYCGAMLPNGSLRPIFISLANDVGAGKTTLWRLVLLIVCGSANLTSRPKDEDELRKALLSAVMQAAPYLFLDNIKGCLNSPSLEAFTTSDTWRDRILGRSRMFTGENKTNIFLTGNGLTLTPDIARRSLIAELFQEYERPQDRPFRRSLDNPTIFKLRPNALAACWALVRSWDLAGRPKPLRGNSSFPAWSDIVGGIVEHAGFGSCLEPHVAAIGGDTDAEDMRDLVAQMQQTDGWLKFPEVVTLAVGAGLFGLESDDWDCDESKQGTRRRVGTILRRNSGKLFNLPDGAIRLESRGKGRTSAYRAKRLGPSPSSAIEPGATTPDLPVRTPSCTDVTDSTDFSPLQDQNLFPTQEPQPRFGMPY